MLKHAPSIDQQGEIRRIPQSYENLRYENLTWVSHAMSQDFHFEEAGSVVPKVEDRQVGEAQPESVTEENKPQRTRSRPTGPRESAPALIRTESHSEATTEADVKQVGEANPDNVAEKHKPQRTRSRPAGPQEPASTPTAQPRESYSAVADILNTYHFRDSFYERYIPRNLGTNINIQSQNRESESEAPLVSRFDWTSSESSDDGRGRVFVNEQKRVWKKRVGHLKERFKGQRAKIAKSIKSVGVIFKGIRGRRSR